MRVLDRDAITHIKVPLPLPLSWGRTVQPYVPPQLLASSANAAPCDAKASQPAASSRHVDCSDLLAADWRAAGIRRDYQVGLTRAHSGIAAPGLGSRGYFVGLRT